MKKKRRKRKQSSGTNRHHLLFQGKNWSRSKAKLLREVFVYTVNIDEHNMLHNALIHDIPKPPDEEISRLWKLYEDNKDFVLSLNIVQACDWLISNSTDEQFKAAILIQYKFFLN
jgi:hypothetical protein